MPRVESSARDRTIRSEIFNGELTSRSNFRSDARWMVEDDFRAH